MTARDEAIEAMVIVDTRFAHANDDMPVGVDWISVLIDAIPPNVLARLAIEQGGLQLYEPLAGSTPEPLYRLVES